MLSSRSHSPDALSDAALAPLADAVMRRRFVEAARRAELAELVNAASEEGAAFRSFAEQLCKTFEAEIAFVAELRRGGAPPRVIASVGAAPDEAGLIASSGEARRAVAAGVPRAVECEEAFGLGAGHALLAPFEAAHGRRVLVGTLRLYDDPFVEGDRSLLEVVTVSAGQALDRIWAFEDRERHARRQTALVRAAKATAGSMSVTEVLDRASAEIESSFTGGIALGATGDDVDGYRVIAAGPAGRSVIGFRQPPGTGLGGHAVRAGRPLMTQAYQEEGFAPTEEGTLSEIRSAMAAPMRWDGRIRGFITCGFLDGRRVRATDMELLEGFAEMAALACANAERQAKLREAAAVDGLTGCLNRTEFMRLLGQMVSDAEVGSEPLSLVLLDLDAFRSINDAFGHPVGDKTLRAVGRALADAVRENDVVARYGGDEFAVVLPRTSERTAGPVIDRVRAAVQALEVPGGRLTACMGLAELSPGEGPAELVRAADDALRSARSNSEIGALRRARPVSAKGANGQMTDRRARSRAIAGEIGLAVAGATTAKQAAALAVEGIADALGLAACAVLRLEEPGRVRMLASVGPDSMPVGWLDPFQGGVAVALREKHSILVEGGEAVPAFNDGSPTRRRGRQLIVPVMIERRIWGAIATCAAADEELDGVDGELIWTASQHLSAAIRAAGLYDQLSRSMIGTAEALAAALDAKDAYTADHARSIADIAIDVGRELRLSQSALDDLRYGAVFHDIGKIAVPDSLLNKPGPLTDAEFEVVKRHPETGAEILAPVPHLGGVRAIVRHAHEHWDGSGYPDGLRGTEIPLGARIVLAVDAFHAMTSDRPYREAMSEEDACAELRRCSGTQFAPEVVEALLAALRTRGVRTGDAAA